MGGALPLYWLCKISEWIWVIMLCLYKGASATQRVFWMQCVYFWAYANWRHDFEAALMEVRKVWLPSETRAAQLFTACMRGNNLIMFPRDQPWKCHNFFSWAWSVGGIFSYRHWPTACAAAHQWTNHCSQPFITDSIRTTDTQSRMQQRTVTLLNYILCTLVWACGLGEKGFSWFKGFQTAVY